MPDRAKVSQDWHQEDGDVVYSSVYADEVPPQLREAADTAIMMAALDLHVSGPELIWLTRALLCGRRPRLAFRARPLGGIAHVEAGAIGVVIDAATIPADVVEIVSHECAHLAHADEEEALATGRLHRAGYEEAQRKVRAIGGHG
jgi:hypothetical protein